MSTTSRIPDQDPTAPIPVPIHHVRNPSQSIPPVPANSPTEGNTNAAAHRALEGASKPPKLLAFLDQGPEGSIDWSQLEAALSSVRTEETPPTTPKTAKMAASRFSRPPSAGRSPWTGRSGSPRMVRQQTMHGSEHSPLTRGASLERDSISEDPGNTADTE